jgi:type I restriction enzyme, S subunit
LWWEEKVRTGGFTILLFLLMLLILLFTLSHREIYKLLTYDINSMDSGSAIPSTSRDEFYQLPLDLPPLPIQRQIAAILSTFDDKIELNRQMNRTLEAMARALFQSWFVDFDPVRAKMRGEQPEGMDAETAALFPDALVEIEGREVPEGWEFGTIVDVAYINKSVLGKNDTLDKVDYIEISAVSKGEISEIVEYTRGNEPSRARRRLNHGDVALSTVRPDRQAYFLAINPAKSLIASTGFAVASARDKDCWPFIYSALTREEVFTILGQAADGGAYPAVNASVIGDLEMIIPQHKALFQKFSDAAAPLLLQADCFRRESTHLSTLRDSLLPRLLSGEVDVGDWAEAEALEEVMV